MVKYYTRACNFYYGAQSRYLQKKKLSLPLSGNKNISFDKLEIFTKKNNKVTTKIINISSIEKQIPELKKKIKTDVKKIVIKRSIFNSPSIMGILNLTPDSFSDGGKYSHFKKALKQVKLMIQSGANIIDVGGESTRPGAKTIKPSVEWNRIKKIIKIFKKNFSNTLLSVDTRKSEIMEKSFIYKVDIINDVSSFKHDPRSIKVINKSKAWRVIHHMKGTPQNMQIDPKYNNVLLDIYDFFEEKIKQQKKGSILNKKIILDPGIGFGKNLKHNLILMNKISLFHSLGFPILIGTSRKRFISQISGKFDTKERIGGTLSSVIYTLSQGVQIFRVHDVEEVNQGILIYKKILEQ